MLQAREKRQRRNSEANLLQLGAAKRLSESPSKLEKSPTQQRRRSIQMNSPLPSSKQIRSWRKSYYYMYLFYKNFGHFSSDANRHTLCCRFRENVKTLFLLFLFIIKSYLLKKKFLNLFMIPCVWNRIYKDSHIIALVGLYKKKTRSFIMELQSLDIMLLPS